MLEMPVKVVSVESITSAEQVFCEMQRSEYQSEPVPPGTKPVTPGQQPPAQISKETFSVYRGIEKASYFSESCMKLII